MALLPSGVPALGGASAALFVVPVLLTTDTVSSILGFGVPKWGIYDQDNKPVLTADNVVAVDFVKPYRISDYTIEKGDFTSYNKVALPYDSRVIFSQGGSDSDRGTFLNQAETVSASLDLYNLVTPEKTYQNCNVEMYRFARTAEHGLGLLTVEFRVKEIRQTATAAFTQTASPVAAGQINSGSVQTDLVTPQQQSAISELFGP